ncbi:HAD family hydrolase [Pelagibius sp. 7325]|uniref:HAD family hydrolase n=1 Tax=Pelagibius sp. 7325 TaxID=3131994 RepID=UPI0030EBD300
MRTLRRGIVPLAAMVLWSASAFAADLPSWSEGPAKAAIVDFVESVTTDGDARFVPPEDRIAVFDNDGTLWSEQPVYFQFIFALEKAQKLAAADPAWVSTPALKAAAAGDAKGVLAGGEEALLEVVTATHSGMTVPAFTAEVADWLATAKHPTTGRLYTEMVFQPMLELLDYLRAKDFDVYIVSGGGVDFMRAFAEDTYGIPPENVIGSLGNARFEMVDGVPQVMKDPGIAFIDDKGGKPVGIARHIGRRPIFVGGNSDGDLAMAQWSTAGDGPRFALFVHHTDAEREFAYDRESHIGKLDKALDEAAANGWTVVDMAKDWKAVWPE